jgi:hypothetical protein
VQCFRPRPPRGGVRAYSLIVGTAPRNKGLNFGGYFVLRSGGEYVTVSLQRRDGYRAALKVHFHARDIAAAKLSVETPPTNGDHRCLPALHYPCDAYELACPANRKHGNPILGRSQV